MSEKEFSALDAFLALNEIDDEEVSGMLKSKKVNEGKEFSLFANNDELEEAKKVLAERDDDAEIEVIDVDADSIEHLKNRTDYVGQIILRCNKCKANKFIDADKLVQSEDDEKVYNLEDECPHCHDKGYGFEIIGQVGKVPTEEPVEEEPTLDNDHIEDVVTFDNDVEEEPEKVEEPAPENNNGPDSTSDEEIEDMPDFAEEESDGMETSSSEDELDDLELPSLGDEYEEKIPEDEEEHVKEALNETYTFESEWAEKAWMLNQIMVYMNDEEAYYSSWLYIWPDGESEQECDYDFGSKEDYDDLEQSFISHYKGSHEDGLFEAPEAVVAAAHEWDKKLGLAPIENIVREPRKISEALEQNTVLDFMGYFIDPENIRTVVVFNDYADESKVVYQGSYEELPEDVLNAPFVSFDAAAGYLVCNIDSSSTEGNTLRDALDVFGDFTTDKIMLWDEAAGENIFQGSKEDALAEYGDCEFFAFESPERLEVYVNDPELVREELVGEANESLFEAICKANNLTAYRVNNKASNEYWLNESLENVDDLDFVYRNFIINTGDAKLVERFKSETGYKDIVDLAKEKLPVIEAKETVVEEVTTEVNESFNNGELAEFMDLAGKLGFETMGDIDKFAKEHGNAKDHELLVAMRDAVANKGNVTEEVEVCPECGKNPCECACDEQPEEVEEGCKCEEGCECEEGFTSYKNRAELSKAITECKNNNRPYSVRRSVVEGFRYDLITETTHVSKAEFDKRGKEFEDACEEVRKYNVKTNADGTPDFSEVPEDQLEAAKEASDRYMKALADFNAGDMIIDEAKKDDELDKVLDTIEKIEQHADLVNDAVESVEQYDDVIKDIEESPNVENKDELVSRLHHIKGEELKHIDDLESMADLLPKAGELVDEPEKVDEPVEEPEELPEVPVEAPVEDLPVEEEAPVEESLVEEKLNSPAEIKDEEIIKTLEDMRDAYEPLGDELNFEAWYEDAAGKLFGKVLGTDDWSGAMLSSDEDRQLGDLYTRTSSLAKTLVECVNESFTEEDLKEAFFDDEAEEEAPVEEVEPEAEPEETEVKPEETSEETVEIENNDTVEEIIDDMEDVEFDGEIEIKPVEVADGAHEVEEIDINPTEDGEGVEVEIKADPEPMEVEPEGEPEVDPEEVAEETLEEAPELKDEAADELDFDEAKFDEDVNRYFDEAYEDTIIYRTTSGNILDDGTIMLEGLLKNDEDAIETKVRFVLTPIDAINESLTTESVSARTYKVTNDLSEEEFEFRF